MPFLLNKIILGILALGVRADECWPSFEQPVEHGAIYIMKEGKEVALDSRLELLDYLGISNDPTWTQATSGCGQTLLFSAHTPQEVEGFIKKGFDPNHVSDIGTPFEVAINKNRYDIAQVLLDNGADAIKVLSSNPEKTIAQVTVAALGDRVRADK